MFSKIIDQKANKLKFNVDGYLTNQRRKQPIPQQNNLVMRKQPSIITPPPIASSNAPPVQIPQPPPKSNEFQIKTLQYQNKILQKPGMRFFKKQKQIYVYYLQENSRFKLEIKISSENGFVLRRDIQKGMLQFSFKKAQKKKAFRQQNNQQTKWMAMVQLKDQKLTIFLANKQAVKNIHKTFFQGLITQQQIKPYEQPNKVGEQKIPLIQQVSIQQDRGDDDVVKFTMPTEQQLNQTQKFRKSIKDMKQQQKLYIMTDIFKIKKQYEDIDRKKLKCPVFSCQSYQKNYRDISQLKTHLKKSHVELTKHGIQLTEFGTFQYSQKALDLVLYLGKIFPAEMKKIIKKMKTKPVAQ